MYFDKIMPTEYGKAEPWNFVCKKKLLKKAQLLGEENQDKKLSQNFEQDSHIIKRGDSLKIRGL